MKKTALHSVKDVSLKHMNYTEAGTGTASDVGLPAAAKSLSPHAKWEDARHFLL